MQCTLGGGERGGGRGGETGSGHSVITSVMQRQIEEEQEDPRRILQKIQQHQGGEDRDNMFEQL